MMCHARILGALLMATLETPHGKHHMENTVMVSAVPRCAFRCAVKECCGMGLVIAMTDDKEWKYTNYPELPKCTTCHYCERSLDPDDNMRCKNSRCSRGALSQYRHYSYDKYGPYYGTCTSSHPVRHAMPEPIKELIADIPSDLELVGALINSLRKGGKGHAQLWSRVADAARVNDGTAFVLCKRHGFDPEEIT